MRFLAVLLATMLMVSAANAALIDTFVLNVQSGAGNTSNVVLTNGVDYRVSVLGTFNINCFGPCDADAEFYTFGGTPYDRTGFSNTTAGLEIGAGINGVDIDWGPYAPSNVYSTIFTGLGSTINVFYQDSNYGDNVGSLTVQIETLNGTVPEPTTIALMALGIAGMGYSRKKSIRTLKRC